MDKISQLKWRCRRGSLELDLLFKNYLENRYDRASKDEQQYFHELTIKDDAEILDKNNNYMKFLKNV